MADKVQDTWYVTYEVPKNLRRPLGRHAPRATKTFQTEKAAKVFARMKFAEGLNVSAGTINPHLPKRAIALTEIRRWLAEMWE